MLMAWSFRSSSPNRRSRCFIRPAHGWVLTARSMFLVATTLLRCVRSCRVLTKKRPSANTLGASVGGACLFPWHENLWLKVTHHIFQSTFLTTILWLESSKWLKTSFSNDLKHVESSSWVVGSSRCCVEQTVRELTVHQGVSHDRWVRNFNLKLYCRILKMSIFVASLFGDLCSKKPQKNPPSFCQEVGLWWRAPAIPSWKCLP